MTMSYQLADSTLNANYRSPATPYLQLHVGNPGTAGTANIAQTDVPANVVRKAITFGDAPGNHATNDERRILNTAGVEWSGAEIDDSQEITHYSIWSAETNEDLLDLGTIPTPKTTGSDGVTIGIGDIEIAISVFVKP